jgi:hypothetical protein
LGLTALARLGRAGRAAADGVTREAAVMSRQESSAIHRRRFMRHMRGFAALPAEPSVGFNQCNLCNLWFQDRSVSGMLCRIT